MPKLNLGLLFGGRSCEHEVSVTSARSIYKAIDDKKYKVSLIGIDKTGRWHLADNFEQLVTDGEVKANNKIGEVTLSLHDGGNLTGLAAATVMASALPKLDILFPALHGTFGEDGAIQGVFEMAGIPYVGCGVAASALAMDKILAKKILKNAGIPQADYLAVKQSQWQNAADEITNEAEQKLGYPLFVKPANAGSSVGVNRVTGRQELSPAIETAFQYDNKIVIEQAMQNCREVECAILGNSSDDEDEVRASVVGEIIPGAEFYDYQTKYLDDKSQLIVPAKLPEKVAAKIRQLARQAFIEIDAAGLARVDFFVNKKTNQITLNEINTLPGFTPISMYPKLWQATKIPYHELINKLINLAQKSHKQKTNLKRGI